MEERDSPAGDRKDEPPLNSSPYVSLPLPVPPWKSEGSDTYVVHFPRDQVYRIPPPENARIVESHRSQNNSKKGGCCSCCCRILIPVVLVALAIAIFFPTILILYSPKSPEFAVLHFHAKNLSSSKSNHSGGAHQKPEYSISLQLENPNQRMDVQYGNGTMSLNFKGTKISSGRYSSIKQGAAQEIEVVETLYGTKRALPSSIKKSLSDKHSKTMILTIKVPTKVTSWVKNSEKNMIVTCDFKVNTLAKSDAKILSQECRTDF